MSKEISNINNIDNIDHIFSILSKNNENPKTELEYKNNFTLLVAIILSAQSTDKIVNRATKELFSLYDKADKILNLGLDGLKNYIKIIGLYNSKAKNIIALCKILLEKYNGEPPSNFEELNALPGVGRKTAMVFLNCAFNKPLIAVDTHVFRVSRRLGIASGKNILQVEKELNKFISLKWKKTAHHLLILHGRYICKAKKPLCASCCVNNFCLYFQISFNQKNIL